MQPYLFPYLGYYQIASQADVFVFLEDVNFIKRGWIQRNRILVNDSPYLFSVPISRMSQNRLIIESEIANETREFTKLIKTIERNYNTACSFDTVFPEIVRILNCSKKISIVAQESVRWLFSYLGIPKVWRSSCDFPRHDSTGQGRIIQICRALGATHYLNLPGGKNLYSAQEFQAAGIDLQFIDPKLSFYEQGGAEFVPGLSILDPLMRLSKDELRFHIESCAQCHFVGEKR